MKIQYDTQRRIVALSNLSAICDRISGTCHEFYIEKVTPNRVTVGYSNPNEYGTPYPVYAVFPCYPNAFGEKDNPLVVLDYVKFIGVSQDSEDWQSFEQIRDCPQLWRDAKGEWKTTYEIQAELYPQYVITTVFDADHRQFWESNGQSFLSRDMAEGYVDSEVKAMQQRNANKKG